MDFLRDPLPATVQRFADDARALGFAPQVACAPLFAYAGATGAAATPHANVAL